MNSQPGNRPFRLPVAGGIIVAFILIMYSGLRMPLLGMLTTGALAAVLMVQNRQELFRNQVEWVMGIICAVMCGLDILYCLSDIAIPVTTI